MKKILVTGASSGFGRAISEALRARGHSVVGTSRDPEKIKGNLTLVRLDVTNAQEVEKVVADFHQEHGRIDVLINNAGYGIAGPTESTSMGEAKSQLDCNFYGPVRLIQAVLPYMRKEDSGLIINIGSIGGYIGLPFQAFYSASKFALEGLTEALRIELKPFNIEVTNVNPGDFATGFTNNRQMVADIPEIYEDKFSLALKQYEKDENNGADPKILADFIADMVDRGNKPKVRYTVGQRAQKLAVGLKKVIGSRTFEQLMMKSYHQK